MRESTVLFGSLLCGWSFHMTDAVDPYCNENDIELPKHAKRWHCYNPLATDHSKIPIGDKCELICKDNYRLYQGNSKKKFNLYCMKMYFSVSNRSRQHCVADGHGNAMWRRPGRVKLECLPDC